MNGVKSAERRRQQQLQNESFRKILQAWFIEKRWLQVYPILNSSSSISLRILEFLTDPDFVHACREQNVPMSYYIEDANGSGRRLFDLPSQLLALQNGRSKKFMDAFKRWNKDLENGGRFMFGTPGAEVETNVAQLQYFRFLVENHVLSWYRKHETELLRIKNECTESRKRRSSSSSGSGRGLGSVCASEDADVESVETSYLPSKRRRSSVASFVATEVTGVTLNL